MPAIFGVLGAESQNRPSPCPRGLAGETASAKIALRHVLSILLFTHCPALAWHKYSSTHYVQSYNDAEVAEESRDCSGRGPHSSREDGYHTSEQRNQAIPDSKKCNMKNERVQTCLSGRWRGAGERLAANATSLRRGPLSGEFEPE